MSRSGARGAAANTAANTAAHPSQKHEDVTGVPHYTQRRSAAELASFRDFANVMRDAIGEYGRVKEHTPAEAAKLGCLGTLKSLHRRGRVRFDDTLCGFAASAGQLEVLKWLRENGCPWGETSSWAVGHGRPKVLQWAIANGCPWDAKTCKMANTAVKGRHLEVLKVLHANGCQWDEGTCAGAAMFGHLEELQWLRANGCPWNEETCMCAAERGHLDVLQWARENGCPWDVDTCSLAAKGSHLEVLQ